MKLITLSVSKHTTTVLLLCLAVMVINGCKKAATTNNNNNTNPGNPLVAYKNSSHHIFVGYLVGDGNDPVPAYNPANDPTAWTIWSSLQAMIP